MSNARTPKAERPASAEATRAKRITRPRKGQERLTLRAMREAMGKSQADVARALHAEQSEISRVERRPDVMLSTLKKYAAALGADCEVAFVFPKAGHRIVIAEPTE